MIRAFVLLAALAFAAPVDAGTSTKRITVDGFKRSYLLYVPSTPPPPTGRELVIVLHGGGGTARQIQRSTKREFNRHAAKTGTLVVYPQAINRLWDFREGVISNEQANPRDDLTFLTAMIDAIARAHPLDRTRIFATGISRGGHASYNLACRAPDLIRAIAPVAMNLPAFLRDDCAGPQNQAIMVINGTHDPLVPWNGGPITLGEKERDIVLSTPETMEYFRRKNGCDRQFAVARIGAVDRITYSNCDTPTILMRVNGGGHTWPSGRSILPKSLVGETNTDISATDEIWRFFQQF